MKVSKGGHQNLLVRHGLALEEPEALNAHRLVLGSLHTSMDMATQPGRGQHLRCLVPMACLAGERYVHQRWFVDAANGVTSETSETGVLAACADEFVFATFTTDRGTLEQQSRMAYEAVLGHLHKLKKPHLLRLWNYIPHINALDSGIERYQHFNAGRRQAFHAMGYSLQDGAPAACALGTPGGPLIVAALASTRPVVSIENPRQISAYHYPAQYGAHPPIFSRAAWLPQTFDQDLLFVSGTASIVGHQSLHLGDVRAQVEESVANIEAVLQSANQRAGTQRWTLEALAGRVYLRDPGDLIAVQALLQSRGMTQFSFVQADICRRELLVEIEAEGQGACELQ